MKKLWIVSAIFTLVFGSTVYAANNEHSLTERQQAVVLNTSNHMTDSDYQIVQLYGTRENEADTLLYTVTNKIDSRKYDEFGTQLPGIVRNQSVTDINIKCKQTGGEYLSEGSNKYVNTISQASALHESSPSTENRTELNLTFEITPASGLWCYQTQDSTKKNVYDSYYIVQRDEIHDKRNVTTKSNVSQSIVMLNLSDPNGSAGTFNDTYVNKTIPRSTPIHMLPNFYPKGTSLSEFDQVYWYVSTESSLSGNKLSDAYKDIDVSARLASNATIQSFMESNHRTWVEVSTDKQLTYSTTETGVDTVYVYCLVHNVTTDKWLISNIEKVTYAYDALFYSGTFEEGSPLTLALIQSDPDAHFIDNANKVYDFAASEVSNLKVTRNDEGQTTGAFTVLPGTHTYYGTVDAGGKTHNVILQITGTEKLFKAVQLQKPQLGEYWIDDSTNMFKSTGSGPYFNYQYGDTVLSYPGNSSQPVYINSISPVSKYIREHETLVNVTLSVYGQLKHATFIARATYAGNDTTDTTTSILSIALTKNGSLSLTRKQIEDNDVSSIRNKLRVTATRYDGSKFDVTENALFNVRLDGRYAIVVASYAQCTSSIAVNVSD